VVGDLGKCVPCLLSIAHGRVVREAALERLPHGIRDTGCQKPLRSGRARPVVAVAARRFAFVAHTFHRVRCATFSCVDVGFGQQMYMHLFAGHIYTLAHHNPTKEA